MTQQVKKIEDVKLEQGKSYRVTFGKNVVDFVHDRDHFYEMLSYQKGGKPKERPWVIFKDLPNWLSYLSKNALVTRIDDDAVLFDGRNKQTTDANEKQG